MVPERIPSLCRKGSVAALANSCRTTATNRRSRQLRYTAKKRGLDESTGRAPAVSQLADMDDVKHSMLTAKLPVWYAGSRSGARVSLLLIPIGTLMKANSPAQSDPCDKIRGCQWPAICSLPGLLYHLPLIVDQQLHARPAVQAATNSIYLEISHECE